MNYFRVNYDAYLIVGVGRPWARARWQAIAVALDPLIEAADAPAGVRSSQLEGPAGKKMKKVSFGRIAWDAKGHAAWTHASEAKASSRIFGDVEVWAPGWAQCKQRDRAPDVYFQMCNSQFGGARFANPLLLLAVARDLEPEAIALGREAAQKIADATSAIVRMHRQRPWARPLSKADKAILGPRASKGAFSGALQDLLPEGAAFKASWAEVDKPSAKMFAKGWSPF